ncbi:MAG: hypothetical protein HC902_04650 [Calothrix sp. SM1_5_4]|nr:hypothetical protein [Calothrix sp. SM1_5_4]
MNTFQGSPTVLTASTNALFTVVKDDGNNDFAVVGSADIDRTHTLHEIRLTNYNETTGNAEVFLSYQSVGTPLGASLIQRKFLLQTQRDPSTFAMTSCKGIGGGGGGGADTLWQKVGATDDIYYDAGLVGIGSASPVQQLHVASSTYAGLILEGGTAQNWAGMRNEQGPVIPLGCLCRARGLRGIHRRRIGDCDACRQSFERFPV